jgi:hypothetical protein
VPGRATALRALLLEALEGCDERVLEGLGPFASWTALAVLHDSGWLGSGRRSLRAAAAQLRGRLREIAGARHPIAAALALPAGTPLLVGGNITAVSALDVVVADDSGESAHVRPGDVRWLSAVTPLAGDPVTILGVVDSEVDPTCAPHGPRALPRRVVIRAAAHPVIAHLGAMALDPRAR